MSKLCCCTEPELPDISINVNCVCCESRMEEQATRDVTDGSENERDEAEDETTCCCFRRKRHAKSKKVEMKPTDGREA